MMVSSLLFSPFGKGESFLNNFIILINKNEKTPYFRLKLQNVSRKYR
ncbi:hypothetical protein FB2170_06345 [Maribacter sp. HTCC2170]|nr:hypothetical protein FB2170_06345 [Maribacter sp. HTCC2170]